MFHLNNLSFYTVPSQNQAALYAIVNGYFGTNCSFQCDSITIQDNNITAKLGYDVGNLTVICPRVDTFLLGYVNWGTVNVTTVIGESPIGSCDSFYASSTYYNTVELLPNNIHSSNELNFSIAPNPAYDYVTVTFPDKSVSGTVYISNAAGVLIEQLEIKPSTLIPIGYLPAGIYLVTVVSGNKTRIIKFVKGL
jgi:hypothetical protein